MVFELSLTFIGVIIIVFIFNSDLVSGKDRSKINTEEERRKMKIEALKKANDRIRDQNILRKNLSSKGRG